jgi:hypothetical protein
MTDEYGYSLYQFFDVALAAMVFSSNVGGHI